MINYVMYENLKIFRNTEQIKRTSESDDMKIIQLIVSII